ncbi:MAG: c-type cytochrome [Kofleriaceae bacterium]|nr:c-type cytochrome [Kofleriaceae bacterium]
MRALAALAVLAVLAGCAAPRRAAAPRWSPAWLAAARAAYLDDPAARRAALVASLTNPRNTYSRHRLGQYALGDAGWDLLPPWNPRAQPLDRAVVDGLAAGQPLPTPTAPLWDGARPTDDAAWIALGRRVFFAYPLRDDVGVAHLFAARGAAAATARDATAEALGIERAADGSYPGLVVFADVDGVTRLGITCALCHSARRGATLVVGTARRRFDLGALRLAYHRDTGAPIAPALAARMASWGPGRADVTEDEDEDPVAIPELWGLRERRYLTQAGTIRHGGPAALAIRQETQLLHAGGERVRPPRELAWALAMYLYSLTPPPPAPVGDARARARGAALFDQHCRRCHRDPAGGGDALPAAQIGTDPALANGRARGTGRYRTPALLGLAASAPYLHDGSVASLADLLAPPPGRGHRFGEHLPAVDRAALIAFLASR